MTFELTILLKLVTAMALGICIGLERQFRQRSAGLRTNVLVSVGAAGFMLLSFGLTPESDNTDITRIAAQIVTGIGFLGAGVIMKTNATIQGLNTAATLWGSAAVGALCGAGMYFVALMLTGVIVFTHLSLRPLGHLINKIALKSDENEVEWIKIQTTCKEISENYVRAGVIKILRKYYEIEMKSLKSTHKENSAYTILEINLEVNSSSREVVDGVVDYITSLHGVSEVVWEKLDRNQK